MTKLNIDEFAMFIYITKLYTAVIVFFAFILIYGKPIDNFHSKVRKVERFDYKMNFSYPDWFLPSFNQCLTIFAFIQPVFKQNSPLT